MDNQAMLAQLEGILTDLNKVQSWIDDARLAAPANQIVQNQLDRQQIEVDFKREHATIALNYLRARN